MLDRLKAWAHALERDVVAVHLAARDPRVPWHAKVLALCVAAYALSPVDLIPDFIPVLGYLDDLVLVPLGILAVIRLVPAPVMAELRGAASRLTQRPVSRRAALVTVLAWILALVLAAWIVGDVVLGGTA